MRSYTELFRMQKSASYETIRKVASLIKAAKPEFTQAQLNTPVDEDNWQTAFKHRSANWRSDPDSKRQLEHIRNVPKLGLKESDRIDRAIERGQTFYQNRLYGRQGETPLLLDRQYNKLRDQVAKAISRANIYNQKAGDLSTWSANDLFNPRTQKVLTAEQLKSRIKKAPKPTLQAMLKARQYLDRPLPSLQWKGSRTPTLPSERTIRDKDFIDWLNIFGNYKKPGTSNTGIA